MLNQPSVIHNSKEPILNTRDFESPTPSLLNSKREREKNSCCYCNSSEVPVLLFTSSKQLINHLYNKVLNSNIDIKTKNDLLTLNIPNKTFSISLCNNCLITNVFTKGLDFLIEANIKNSENGNQEEQSKEENKNINDEKVYQIEQNLYMIYVNSIYKKLKELHEMLMKNSIETEQIMNKMALHLMGENRTVFQKFHDDMNFCKMLMQQDRDNLLNTIEKCFKNKECDNEITSLLDGSLQKILTDEKINNLNNVIKETLSEQKKKKDLEEEKEKNTLFKFKNNNGVTEIVKDENDHQPHSINTSELQVESQPKISIEAKSKVAKKKSYIIRSLNPIYEISPSNPKNTPITQSNKQNEYIPISDVSSPQLNNGNFSSMQNPQIKQQAKPLNPQEQNPLLSQLSPHLSQQPIQMQFQPSFSQLYDHILGGNNLYTLMTMKNMLQNNQGFDNMQLPMFAQSPNLLFPNLCQNYLDLNLLMQQNQKLGQKLNFPTNFPFGNINSMGGTFNNMLSQNQVNSNERNDKDLMQNEELTNMKFINMLNEIAKQENKGKGPNTNDINNSNN